MTRTVWACKLRILAPYVAVGERENGTPEWVRVGMVIEYAFLANGLCCN